MDNDDYLAICLQIDDMSTEVSDFEANFLESMLLYCPPRLSEKQKSVIRHMAWRYLGEEV